MNNVIDAALVVVDVQERLLSVVAKRDSLVENISKLAIAANYLGMPILWCRQNPNALGDYPDSISKHLTTAPIDKMCFSCSLCAEFDDKLSSLGVRDVVVCGIESHICVYQTSRDLSRKGYNVEVVSDAISSRDLNNTRIAIERMRAESISVSSLEMTLFDLLGTAEHPRFRDIAKLIK